MRTALERTSRGARANELVSAGATSNDLLKTVLALLDEAKAEEVVSIDLKGKSSIGDHMVIASGLNDRHVGAIADQLQKKMKEAGVTRVRVEGADTCDWVLIDTGDIIVHVFRPEVREFYNLERMWGGERPADSSTH